MPSRQVYLSGQLVPEEEAKISVFDSAVLLGDTVTESTRTFAHKPFKLAPHVDRLFKSLKVTRIDPGCDAAEMVRITHGVSSRPTCRATRPTKTAGWCTTSRGD